MMNDKIQEMTRPETIEDYEINTHRELFNRLNDTERKVERLFGGISVFAFLICVFGGFMWNHLSAISDNTKILARIEQKLQNMVEDNCDFKEELKQHGERLNILERTK